VINYRHTAGLCASSIALPAQYAPLIELFQCAREVKMTKATRGRCTLEFKQETGAACTVGPEPWPQRHTA